MCLSMVTQKYTYGYEAVSVADGGHDSLNGQDAKLCCAKD